MAIRGGPVRLMAAGLEGNQFVTLPRSRIKLDLLSDLSLIFERKLGMYRGKIG